MDPGGGEGDFSTKIGLKFQLTSHLKCAHIQSVFLLPFKRRWFQVEKCHTPAAGYRVPLILNILLCRARERVY